MIKTIGISSILLSSIHLTESTFSNTISSTVAGYTTAKVAFHKIRGNSPVAIANRASDAATIRYVQTDGMVVDFSSDTDPLLSTPLSTGDGYGKDVAFARDHVTGNMLFISETGGAIANAGYVYYYRGDYTQWSVSQTLSPPAEFAEASYYGAAIDVDLYHLRQLAVGCKNCNTTHSGAGTIYVYEPTSPDVKSWKQTAALTMSSNDGYKLGGYNVEIYNDVLVADYDDAENEESATSNAVVFHKPGPKWVQSQELSVGSNITDLAVFDQTIVIGAGEETVGADADAGAVYVYYPNTAQYRLKPKGKPVPVQWSVQQVLYPATSTADDQYGAHVALDDNRMVVGTGGSNDLYIYQREQVYGKWSLQQSITATGNINDIELNGANIVAQSVSGETEVFDETGNWDCLIISVEDHLGDGWDTAQLTVEVPDGDKDYFYQRCDTENAHQFRYCPAALGDEGLYKFSIPDGVKAKFYWEILWRVYEEKTGMWYTGNWDTKMDFHWDATEAEFTHRKISDELPNNITCKFCKNRPTSTRVRHLKGKDSTAAPTISPAPTVEVDDDANTPWQWLTLVSGAGNEWFDAEHKGTNYYISDIKAHRLLSTGTMCPGEATTKACWEDYPDGDYILRVGGALDLHVATNFYTFCKSANNLEAESQLVFRVTNGECSILSYYKTTAYCKQVIDILELASVKLVILGFSGTEFDTIESVHFGQALASVVKGVDVNSVKFKSFSHSGSGLSVTAEFAISGKSAGKDFYDVDVLEDYETYLRENLASNTGRIRTALQSEEIATGFHTITDVKFVELSLTGGSEKVLQNMGVNTRVENFADTQAADYHTETNASDATNYTVTFLAVAGYFVVAAAMVAVGIAVFVRPRVAAAKLDIGPPVASVHSGHQISESDDDADIETAVDPSSDSDDAVQTEVPRKSAISSDKLTLSDLHELVRLEDESLKILLNQNAM